MKSAALNGQDYQFKTKANMKTKTSILTLTRVIFILLVMCCFSCCSMSTGDENENKKATATNIDDNVVKNQGIQILTIDSCEYVWVKNGNGAGLTHKGNCKYCAERAKRSLK